MALYDRNTLSQAVLAFIETPSDKYKENLFKLLLNFAQVSAVSAFRNSLQMIADFQGHEHFVEDLVSEFAFQTLNYFDSERFDCKSWTASPMACLNQFFQCRAIDFYRAEMNKVSRKERLERGRRRAIQEPFEGEMFSSHYPSPYRESLAAEAGRAYEAAMARLPAKLVPIIRLRWEHRLSNAEVAVKLKIPVEAVYAGTREAKRLLSRDRGLRELQEA
jgi:DNA-directed RNA polymerase specialized sigma24 family protein